MYPSPTPLPTCTNLDETTTKLIALDELMNLIWIAVCVVESTVGTGIATPSVTIMYAGCDFLIPHSSSTAGHFITKAFPVVHFTALDVLVDVGVGEV
jgi:hypothetical protein